MATNEKVKSAMREIRKTLHIKVHLVKTSTQKENIKGNFFVSVFVTKNKVYIGYPRSQKIANKIFEIFKSHTKDDFRMDWDGTINTSIVLIPTKD